MQLRGLLWEDSGEVAVGSPLLFKVPANGQAAVSVTPGATANSAAKVEFSIAPEADIDSGAASWFAWPLGTAGVTTEAAVAALEGPLRAVRITASVSACRYEFCQQLLKV